MSTGKSSLKAGLDTYDVISAVPFIAALAMYWKSRKDSTTAQSLDGDAKMSKGRSAQFYLLMTLLIFLIASIANASMVLYNYDKHKAKLGNDPLALSNMKFARTNLIGTAIFVMYFGWVNKSMFTESAKFATETARARFGNRS